MHEDKEFFILGPEEADSSDGQIVITSGDSIVPRQSGELFWPPEQVRHFLPERPSHFLGNLGDSPCSTVECNAAEAGLLGLEPQSLRSYLGQVPDSVFRLLGRAVQINRWFGGHRYCGACGSPTQPASGERAMHCPRCEMTYYPRLSPCVMALIVRGEECLLARNIQWTRNYFSVIAGFVEPGEGLEQAVQREVLEEVGVQLENIRYFASQPWPFPGQLMIGFIADYAGGDIQVDQREIAEAHWFRTDDLPPIPGEFSLSGQMIRAFVESSRGRSGI